MNKKNILTAAVSLSLVACLSIGATLAYFTDTTATKVNTIGNGHVDIDIVDELPVDYDFGRHGWTAEENGSGIEYEHVMPGDIIAKKVGVTIQKGSEPAYIGLKVKVNADDELIASSIANSIHTNDNESRSDWDCTLYDSETQTIYFTHDAVAYQEGGDNEYTVFERVLIPEYWTNAQADATFSIEVTGYAIQQANVDYDEFQDMFTGDFEFEAYQAK